MKSQEFKVSKFQELSELKVTFTCVLQIAFTYTSELVNYTSVLFTDSIASIETLHYFLVVST